MPVTRLLMVLALSLSAAGFCEAGSGSRSAGSGSRSYGNGGGAGSGSRASDPTVALLKNDLQYSGKLAKGEVDGNKDATMSGVIKLLDGFVVALADSSDGSGSRSASAGGPRALLVGYQTVARRDGSSSRDRNAPPPTDAIGEYRLSRRGKLTILLGTSSKRLASREADGGEGSGKKRDGSDKRTAVSTTATASNDTLSEDDTLTETGVTPLNGVMVLSHKKLRSGEFWGGNFREQDAKGKTVRTWQIRLEPRKRGGFSA